LAGTTTGGVTGQLLVHLIAQKEDIEPQAAVLDEAVVADQVLQAADQHQLEEDYPVKRGLPV
jgi:hypothetical protein